MSKYCNLVFQIIVIPVIVLSGLFCTPVTASANFASDLAAVLAAMDAKDGDANWDSSADHDDDGEVTSSDLSIVLTKYYVSVPSVNGKYYLSQWSSPSLHNALLELNAVGQVTLVIDNSSTLTQSETVDPEVTLEFPGGGKLLNVPSGYTLAIRSPVRAGFYQIFDSGTGTIIVPGEKHIEWWGAKTGNALYSQQGVNKAAFQRALDNQGLITFTSAIYQFNGGVRMNSHTILQGSGKTRLIWTHTGVGIDFYMDTQPGYVYEQNMENWAIRDLGLEGARNGYSNYYGGNVGLLIGYNSSGQRATQWGGAHVERVVFYNWGDAGLKCDSSVWSLDVEGCRFENLSYGIYIDNASTVAPSQCTGIEISKSVFNYIGKDCLYAKNDLQVKFGPGNMTERCIKGYYTHLNGSLNPYVYGNRLEGGDNASIAAFGHRWDNVTGGTFKGGSNEENIYLGGACIYNDIEVATDTSIWKPSYKGGAPGVYEEAGNGCRDNRIVMRGGNADYGTYGYGADNISIQSEVHPIDKCATPVTLGRILTDNLSNPSPGTYLLDTTADSITVNLPPCNANPFAEWTFRCIAQSGSNTVTIVPRNTDTIDSGMMDGYQSNYVLNNVGDQVTLRPVPQLTKWTNPYSLPDYLTYLSSNWYSVNKRGTNTFSTADAVSTIVSDGNIRSTSVVLFYPNNAAAAGLQGSTKCLFLSNVSDGSFTVTTADGSSAGTTAAQFRYVVK